MNKLGEFFQTRRSKRGLHKETVPFPPLSAEEEQEIKDKLGIEPTADLEATVRSTLRKIKQVEIAEEVNNTEEDYEEIGTVRIKGMPDGDKFGTIRRKRKQEEEDEDWGSGTVKFYSSPQAFFSDDRAQTEDKTDDADGDDQYGTMRIKHESSDEDDEEVEKKEEKADKKNRPKRKPLGKRVKKDGPQFVYRPPEEWELNIIAIERGEWSEHMSEEAFRKYKKERPKLKDCAFLVEEETAVTEKPTRADLMSAFAGKPTDTGTSRRGSNTIGAQRMKENHEENTAEKKSAQTNANNGTSVDPGHGQRAFAAMKKAGAAVNIKKK